MPTCEGQIQQIFENQTKNGDPYWVLIIDGKRISFWPEDKKEISKVREGDLCTVEYVQKGRWLNGTKIKEIVKPKGRKETTPNNESPNPSTPGSETEVLTQQDKDSSMKRQSAVRTAAILLQGREISDEDLKTVTKTTYQFIKTGTFNEHQED